MIIEIERDPEVLFQVLLHPDIFKAQAPDGVELTEAFKQHYAGYLQREDVIPITVRDTLLMAVYILNRKAPRVWQIHANVLPEHRERSLEISKAVLDWVASNLDYRRLETHAPTHLPYTFKHALAAGFILKRIIPAAFRQGGRERAIYQMVKY